MASFRRLPQSVRCSYCPVRCQRRQLFGTVEKGLSLGTNLCLWMGLIPKRFGDLQRLDVELLPPSHLIARLMQLPVIAAAERNGELVADFKPDSSRLRKPQVMRVGRLAATYETGLRRHKLQMRLVAQPFGLGNGEDALVDPVGNDSGRVWRKRRCQWGWGRPHCPFGLASFIPEVLGNRVLMPAAIIVRWPWDRRRVIGVKADTGISSNRHG